MKYSKEQSGKSINIKISLDEENIQLNSKNYKSKSLTKEYEENKSKANTHNRQSDKLKEQNES
jgi:hypothetical protein